MNIFQPQPNSARGFTLVELMIVVAIVGILAAVASVAYTKYLKSAKITKLKQYAMEVANAQEQYKSQNSGYLDIGDNSNNAYSEGDAKWENLLGFSKKGLAAQNITIHTVAGDSTSTVCGDVCEGLEPDLTTIWYAVRVQQDFDTDTTEKTTIVLTSEIESPMLFNEGE